MPAAPRGRSPRHSHGASHSAIGRISVNGPQSLAQIVIDRHHGSYRIHVEVRRRLTSRPRKIAGADDHLSGDNGISTPPFTCLIGPAALGMMSKSKISVGSQSVAQALGISTTPEMWPWHGAVPRIA